MGKTKRNNKKAIILIVILVLALGLAVGYATFSDTLTISGTANAKGTFDLEFQNYSVVAGSAKGVDTTNTTIERSADKDTLTVTVADLAYPGAGVQFHTDIVNVGTIPAKIKAVTPTGLDNTNRAIKITGLDAITTSHPTIEKDGVCSLDFAVEWDKTKDLVNASGDTVSFSLVIEYEQDTTDFAGSAAHSDS